MLKQAPLRVATRATGPWGLPKRLRVVLALASAYVVLPFVNIPILGLSLSAPLFLFLIVETMLRPELAPGHFVRRWTKRLAIVGAGFSLANLAALLFGVSPLQDFGDFILLLRYGFWLVIAAVTARLVSCLRHPARLLLWLGRLGLVLASVVVGIAVVFGLPDRPPLLSRNSFGFLFSTFFPLSIAYSLSHRRKVVRWGGPMLFLLAAIANRSRGSWIAIALELIVLGLLLAPNRSAKLFLRLTAVLAFASALLFFVAPAPLLEKAALRFETFQNLDDDKSYLVRKALQQKGWELFVDNPITGVGFGGFQRYAVDVDLPARIAYYTSERFNSRSSHNSWVQLLAETGLLGTLPMMVLLAGLLLEGGRLARRNANRGDPWPSAILATLIGMCTHMWVISAITGTHTWYIFGVCAGTMAWYRRWWNNAAPATRPGRRSAPLFPQRRPSF